MFAVPLEALQWFSALVLPHQAHNGIHDAVCRYANHQGTSLTGLVYTCFRISGTSTYDAMNLLQSMANRIAIFPSDAMDEQIVYHRPSKS